MITLKLQRIFLFSILFYLLFSCSTLKNKESFKTDVQTNFSSLDTTKSSSINDVKIQATTTDENSEIEEDSETIITPTLIKTNNDSIGRIYNITRIISHKKSTTQKQGLILTKDSLTVKAQQNGIKADSASAKSSEATIKDKTTSFKIPFYVWVCVGFGIGIMLLYFKFRHG